MQSYFLIIWTEDPERLVKFYTEVLGMETGKSLKLEDDYGYALYTKEGDKIWIGKHSEATGKTKDMYRFTANFYVDDVHEWHEKLKNRQDIEIIAEPFVMPPTRNKKEKRYAFTFTDPDGNMLQMTTR